MGHSGWISLRLPPLRSVTSPAAPTVDNRDRAYREIADWIAQQPQANGTLLASEIGIFGYALATHRVVDIVGLTDPEVPAERFFDYRWHIERYEPDYVLLFLAAAQLDRHEIPLSDGRRLEYRRVLVPKHQFRGAALFERGQHNR